MKKGFFILILVLTINISAPGNTLYQRQRHLIEYTQETNYKSSADDVLIKNKAVIYMRYVVLINRILLIDLAAAYCNSS